MNIEEMRAKGALVIPDLGYGFDHYPYEIVKGTPLGLKQFLAEKIAENGWDHSYVDFYYGELQPEERDNVDALLEHDQKVYLQELPLLPGEPYYQLNQELFEITALLSVREGLFSTFYFTKQVCTVWSNYNGRFAIFYQSKP